MAKIAVVTHAFDQFAFRTHFWSPRTSRYLLFDVLREAEKFGHRWRVVTGARRVAADVGILHVDTTRVADDYLVLAGDYPVRINFAARDISKRRVSKALLERGDDWAGPVIVKSDLNTNGVPENRLNRRARTAGAAEPFPGHGQLPRYVILSSIAEVPETVWRDGKKVVERFLPETDPQGFALRTWVFMGPRERCTRHVSPEPIVKARNVVSRTPAEVPDALREERTRLGFDYGKFDFVMRDGQPVLLDANRTPGTVPNIGNFVQEGARNLAEGLHELIQKH